MRPKGIIGLLVIAAIIGAIFYFLSDRFIEDTLESTGSSIAGAKVEIDNLDFDLLGLSLAMDRLQVANANDTWKNLFETGRLAFDMEVLPLTRKKFIIKEVTIADVRIGTKRETDGKLEKIDEEEEPGWVSNAAQSLKKRVAEAPVLNLGILKKKINVDSLISAFDIQSLDKISQSRKDAETAFKTWDTALSELKPQEDLKRVRSDIQTLQSAKLSSLDELVAAADKAKSILKTLDELKKDVEEKKKTATGDFKRLSSAFTGVDNWLKDDFNAIKSKANIGDFNAQNVGKMLFGDVVVLPTIQMLEYVGVARKYMPVAQQFMASGKVEKPPRFTGQDIQFPVLNKRPRFLLENIHLSAATNQADQAKVLTVNGEVHGITSEPTIYGKPLTFALDVDVPGSSAYKVTGTFDHSTEMAKDQIEISANAVDLGSITLPSKPYLPNSLQSNSGNIKATVAAIDDELDVKIEFSASPVTFAFAKSAAAPDAIAKVTRKVFDDIEQLRFIAGISGRSNDLSLSVSSNIDAILAARIKGVIGESARLARQEIERKLRGIVEPKKKEALAFVDQNKKRIEAEIDKVKAEVDEHRKTVEDKKKEIEDRIKKEKDKGLKKVKDELKKIF